MPRRRRQRRRPRTRAGTRAWRARQRRRKQRRNMRIPSNGHIAKCNGSRQIKKINWHRRQCGLPPIIVNRQLNNSQTWNSNQWTSAAADYPGVWNYIKNLHTVAMDVNDQANTDYERQSNRIYFKPFKLKIPIQQLGSLNGECVYRIMLIKINSMRTVEDLQPQDILSDTNDTASRHCSCYKLKEQRSWAGNADQNTKMMVLQDKRFVWNSYQTAGKKASFMIKMNVPGANVEYDPATIGGTKCKGAIALCIATNATPASADYTFGRNYCLKFYDLM